VVSEAASQIHARVTAYATTKPNSV